jgi:hypothetical protein
MHYRADYNGRCGHGRCYRKGMIVIMIATPVMVSTIVNIHINVPIAIDVHIAVTVVAVRVAVI